MQVELRQSVGLSVRTRKPVRFPKYDIIVDGNTLAGHIGTQENAKAMFIVPYAPLEQREIERQIAELLDRDEVQSVTITPVPNKTVERNDSEETIDVDEFDA